MSPGRWAAGLLLISAALLGYELLLMRLLALAYWGHFAGMVISIAMLGIASSGLFLFYARDRIKKSPAPAFALSAGCFALAAPLAFLFSQQLPFTPFLLTWSPREYGLLAGRSLLFFAAFFLAGISVGVPFVARVLPAGRLYFWNMLGSGLPALPLLWAMNFAHPMRLLSAVVIVAVMVPVICFRNLLARICWAGAALLVAAAVIASPFRYSEYKELPRTLLLPDSRLVAERYGWDGVIQIVDSPHTRYVPGLSLNFSGTLPASQLVFTDAGAMTLAFDSAEALANPDFLRMTPEAFSFALAPMPRVLHFYGGVADLMRARALGAREVRVIDDSAARVSAIRSLVDEDFGREIEASDPRQLLEREQTNFDLIAVSLLGTHGTSTAGAASLDTSYLLTNAAFARIMDRLTPAGHAVISTWVENPPRSGVRLAALCIDALRSQGIERLSAHLIGIRSWSTLSIFVGREPFSADAVAALKTFCDTNSFDLVWFDGIDPADTNQINVLPEGDAYHAAFAALLGTAGEEFVSRSPFAIAPPTDDRPFFNQSFRWAALPQWISMMGMSWLPFVEWGYILHVATLVIVALLGLLLLLVPRFATRARPKAGTILLFFLLGVGYMFVQIWAIHKLSQFVAHPLLAAALVLFAMLAASGAGAAILTRGHATRPGRNFALVCGALGLAILLFPLVLDIFYPHPIWLRVVIAVAWLGLPAFFMGFPFPYLLGRLTRETDVPWALALNGFGSVLGALLATLVAVHFGLQALALLALVVYAIVAVTSTRSSGTGASPS